MENFDIVKYLRENHLGSHAILGNYVDLHALKEEEVGNNSIDPATLSAIDSWVKKNYPTARTPNPAEVEDVEYYLGTDYIKLYKVEPNDPQQDDFDEDTTIAFINVTIEDGNIIYFEVRESIDYPGDYEQGEGYGEPNGVWDPKTNQFTREGNFSDDEDDEKFMEAEDLEGWKMVKKLAANDKRVAAAFLKPLVTVYGEDNVKIVKQGDSYKIYTKGKEELNNEAEDIKGIETSDLKKGDTVEYEGNEYIIGDFDTAGGANLVYLKTMDGEPAEDSKGRYKKVHKSRVKKLNKEADYGNNQPVDEVPYGDGEGRLDGFGDEFDQVAPVEEKDSMIFDKGWQYDDDDVDAEDDMDSDTRFADLGGKQIKTAIKSLMDSGFPTREIAQFVVDTIRSFKK